MKKILLTILALLCIVGSQAKDKVVVWEKPTTEYGNVYGDGFFNIAIDLNRVELKETETTVSVTVSLRNDYDAFKFKFLSGTCLLADGIKYPLVSADGIELDKFVKTNADNKRDIVFHFQPLPLGTKVFDFIEGDIVGSIKICGIRPVEERHKMLFPSYWRNESTGNWDIAFLGDHAIYDCKIWDMKAEMNERSGEADITMTLGNETHKVKMGKDRKGKRTISIDGKKTLYSMITDRFLPDYPTKDTTTQFVDTDYKRDTVTVIGWLKDMPEKYRNAKTFEFSYDDLFTGELVSHYADLDSLGRFIVKFPVINSTEFFCDWERCFVHTMLEPGKTYFLLNDFKEGRRMFMGEDVRLQNELFKYPLDWSSIMMEKGDDFNVFFAKSDSIINAQHKKIDELCSRHPMLSKRYNIYGKNYATWNQAYEMGQARYNIKGFKLPDNARKYVYDNFWTKMPKPYTLYRDVGNFLTDFMDDAVIRHPLTFKSPDELFRKRLHIFDNCLDSLRADKTMKCVCITKLVHKAFDGTHKALSQELMDTLKTWITIPSIYDDVVKRNDYYIALANRQLDKLVMKTDEGVAGMTEGKEILKKLLEPYKGKIVLIDVWGTWCGPCTEALKHSQEEYKQLAKYDIQYVYFANRSSKDSWENVIKEYDVTGPNVSHFNLPNEQQSAIERYLKVKSFPTYKLVDPQGNVLDIKVDARNLKELEELIKMLKVED